LFDLKIRPTDAFARYCFGGFFRLWCSLLFPLPFRIYEFDEGFGVRSRCCLLQESQSRSTVLRVQYAVLFCFFGFWLVCCPSSPSLPRIYEFDEGFGQELSSAARRRFMVYGVLASLLLRPSPFPPHL